IFGLLSVWFGFLGVNTIEFGEFHKLTLDDSFANLTWIVPLFVVIFHKTIMKRILNFFSKES
ncbi:MAG: hypothetical protein RL154_1332, partial [Pseudomonadota bacterium]